MDRSKIISPALVMINLNAYGHFLRKSKGNLGEIRRYGTWVGPLSLGIWLEISLSSIR